jgi:hypothetical protein
LILPGDLVKLNPLKCFVSVDEFHLIGTYIGESADRQNCNRSLVLWCDGRLTYAYYSYLLPILDGDFT